MLEPAVDHKGAFVARPEVLGDLLHGIGHIVHRGQGFGKMGIGKLMVIVQPLNNVLKGGNGGLIQGYSKETMGRWIQPDADLSKADGPTHGIQRLEKEAGLVFVAAAVFIGPHIGAVGEELMKKISVGGMDFDAVKARGDCIFSGPSEVLGGVMNLVRGEGMGSHGILKTLACKRFIIGVDCRGGNGQPAVMKIRMRHAAAVPELAEDVPVPVVYGPGHLSPAFNLRPVVYAGGVDVTDGLL